jgi:signal transduction histidine kinase
MSRLHSRIYLHSLAVVLVVGLATSLVFVFGAGRAFFHDMNERVARHLASLVAEHMDDRRQLGRRVVELRDELGVGLIVRDQDGRILAEARGGRRAWHTIAPILDPRSRSVVGTVEVIGPRPRGGGWPLRPVLIVLVVLFVAALVTRPLARRLSRPLERLTEATRRLGAGDLSYRVPVEPLRDHERGPNGACGIRWWRNRHRVDELETLTHAFNEMADRVERIVRGQKELLANISHELRSPLTRMRVALELVPRDAATEARLREIESDLAALDRLIEDVLATARLDATGLPSHIAHVDVRTMLRELAERAAVDPLVAGTLVTIEDGPVRTEDGPARTEDGPARTEDGPALTLMADEALLKRALWNLVENAAKYGAPPIVLAATLDEDRVKLSVRDHGPGIAPADRERVFAPFERLDAARTPSAAGEPMRGVGLGLTLARRIAEAHGGTAAVTAVSIVDGREQGCRVTLTIPSARRADPAPA